jgi:hypothetical protein
MSGCKASSGTCVHDLMMMGMGMMIALAAGAHWGLHLF